MKCSHCGREISAEQLEENKGLCPHCGKQPDEQLTGQQPQEQPEANENGDAQQEQPQKPVKKRSPLPFVLGAIVLAAAAAAVIWLAAGGSQQTVTAQDHKNPTVLAYTSDDAIGFAKGEKMIGMYLNEAQDEEQHRQVANGLSLASPYIGSKNYVELDNGDVVYLPMTFETTAEMVGDLRVKKTSGEEEILDKAANLIYCSNGLAVYYNKLDEDGKLQQIRYKDGQLSPMSEVAGQENIVAVKTSADDTLLQVLQLDDERNTIGGGYLYNGQLHLLDSEYTVYNISSKTKDVFAIKMDGEDGLVELYRVSNLETGELEKLGGKISEAMLYGDGSVSFVGDCDLASNKYNPIGSLYLYDPATGAVEKMADNVAAVLESTVRSSGWLNENAKELATGEMMGSSEEEDTLYAGQLHYIDGQGNLCVVAKGSATVGDSGLQGFTIFENFYSVNGYAINYDIDFASATDKALYWSLGDQLYRYQLGSMQSPQVLPLDESLEDKAGNDAQVGYFVTGSGDVVEETEQKLVLKNFDDESSITILENVGQLNLIGMDNDGENIYFISEDNSLYAKSLTSRSNPKRIASDVTQVVATSHGLYFLQKSQQQPVVGQSGEEQEEQTDLMFLQYGQKKASCLLEDVNSISTIYLAE